MELSSLSRARRAAVKAVKFVFIVVKGFLGDNCSLRASGLTYATLLSLVPLLAFAFALISGFQAPMATLKSFIIEKVALGNEEIGGYIFSFVSNINATTMGITSLAILLFTVISVMGNIEASFNHIWGVRKARTIWRKFSDYLSVLLVSPLLITAGVGVGGALHSNRVVNRLLTFPIFHTVVWAGLKLLPWISVCLGFAFLYSFMPNTKVKLKSALIGGLVGGFIWQSALWGYLKFQMGFVKYAQIYGAMAQFPITLVWIYFSWLIVLLGAEVTFAVQNLNTYRREGESLSLSWAYQELVGLNIMVIITRAFRRGEPPPTTEELTGELNVPIRLGNHLLRGMMEVGLINEIQSRKGGFLPARDPATLTIGETLKALRSFGGPKIIPPRLREAPAIRRLRRADPGLTLSRLLEQA